MGCSPSHALIINSARSATETICLQPRIYMVSQSTLHILQDVGELKVYRVDETDPDTALSKFSGIAEQLENPKLNHPGTTSAEAEDEPNTSERVQESPTESSDSDGVRHVENRPSIEEITSLAGGEKLSEVKENHTDPQVKISSIAADHLPSAMNAGNAREDEPFTEDGTVIEDDCPAKRTEAGMCNFEGTTDGIVENDAANPNMPNQDQNEQDGKIQTMLKFIPLGEEGASDENKESVKEIMEEEEAMNTGGN